MNVITTKKDGILVVPFETLAMRRDVAVLLAEFDLSDMPKDKLDNSRFIGIRHSNMMYVSPQRSHVLSYDNRATVNEQGYYWIAIDPNQPTKPQFLDLPLIILA